MGVTRGGPVVDRQNCPYRFDYALNYDSETEGVERFADLTKLERLVDGYDSQRSVQHRLIYTVHRVLQFSTRIAWCLLAGSLTIGLLGFTAVPLAMAGVAVVILALHVTLKAICYPTIQEGKAVQSARDLCRYGFARKWDSCSKALKALEDNGRTHTVLAYPSKHHPIDEIKRLEFATRFNMILSDVHWLATLNNGDVVNENTAEWLADRIQRNARHTLGYIHLFEGISEAHKAKLMGLFCSLKDDPYELVGLLSHEVRGSVNSYNVIYLLEDEELMAVWEAKFKSNADDLRSSGEWVFS